MASWSQLGQLGPHITTLTLRGISKTHNRGSILELLNEAGGKYNFVYMPAGRSTHAGLAIVNFVDAEACQRCFLVLKSMQEQGLLVGIKSIGQSKIQGFSENLAYYVVISRQDERVTDQPLIFVNGQVADQRFLEYLIKTFVTHAMKQRAEKQAEAMYSIGKMGPSPGLQTCGPLQPGCLSRSKDGAPSQALPALPALPAPALSVSGSHASRSSRPETLAAQQGLPIDIDEIQALCDRLGCKTSDGMIVFSL
mmetsp:Transcript_40365/g.63363  ORF Transcript_40365/g.63363 Transcript_40365/m.63363 type:complete len:252 (+) Transcript_40365:33-788(+)